MAKIPRVLQKIFASAALNNGVFGSAQTGAKVISNNLATIMGLPAWANGWLDAVLGAREVPPLEEFQSLNYVNTTQLAYLFQEGIPEYDATTEYFIKSIVKKAGTYELYGSVTNNNTGNALTDPVNWVLLTDLSSSQGIAYGGTSAGAANVQTATVPGFTYTAGKAMSFIAGFTNTLATTFNANALGAKTIKLRTPAGLADLNPGSIVAGNMYIMIYDGTYLQLINESLASLRGVNGYCYNQDGTMDQWGFSNASIAGNVVTFPVAFPVACDNITCAIANNTETRLYTTQATINAANFTFFAATGTALHYWRAKGRWI